MKITYSLLIISILILACNSKTDTGSQKATFGIHEVAVANELPVLVMDTIKTMNILPENKPDSYIIGYVMNEDNPVIELDISGRILCIVPTINKVDRDYYAIAAITKTPLINNSDIKKTRANGSVIELHFTLEGAKKWANLTKSNIGKPVAFVIDNRIYDLPMINAEIKSGIAILGGLKDDSIAGRIAEAISNE